MSVEIPAGAMRFNSDSQKLEYWNGSAWFQVHTATPNLATAGDRQPGARGLFGGGYTPSATKVIDYINISSTGNAIVFGDLTDTNNMSKGSTSSRVRAVWVGGGQEPSVQTTSGEHVIISSTGNSTQFSNALSVSRRSVAGICNGTRAIFAGGRTPSEQNVIDYMEISALTASQDFGDISRSDTISMGSVQSQTRGLFAGGYTPNVNSIDMITMSTLGNSADFGDLLITPGQCGGASNAVRGIFSGDTSINYVTIATLGNATDFGDLSNAQDYCSNAASPTRVVLAAGRAHPNTNNVVEYIQIATTGDAIDFGDLSQARQMRNAGCSNAHGGL